jgi:hypothetical protein
LSEPDYLSNRLYDLEMSQAQGIDAAMKEHALDCLLFPGSEGYGIAARAGYPSVTVPAGYTSAGKPLASCLRGWLFRNLLLFESPMLTSRPVSCEYHRRYFHKLDYIRIRPSTRKNAGIRQRTSAFYSFESYIFFSYSALPNRSWNSVPSWPMSTSHLSSL